MKVWAIANQKGGVGKTTTVISLAGVLAKSGKRVLMIDTDPHASLGYYLGIDSEEVLGSLYDLFVGHSDLTKDKVISYILPTLVSGMDIIPATMALATVDRSFGQKTGMGLILTKIVNLVADKYDVVLIDCSPVLGVLMVNALAASDHILIPVQTEFLALKGLERMIKTMTIMGRSQNTNYSYTIVPTMYDKRTRASSISIETLRKEYSEVLWQSMIPIDTKFRDASLSQLPASHYASYSKGVTAYNELLNYLLGKEFKHVKIG